MPEGWDRKTMAVWVLGLGMALVLIALGFMFWLLPRVIYG